MYYYWLMQKTKQKSKQKVKLFILMSCKTHHKQFGLHFQIPSAVLVTYYIHQLFYINLLIYPFHSVVYCEHISMSYAVCIYVA